MKVQPKTTLSDEDNLEEINLIINNFFNNKRVMTFEEYKYNIENLNSDVFFLFICFLNNNKPFKDSSVKILKLLNRNPHLVSSASSNFASCSEDNCLTNSKQKIKRPSREFKKFVSDLVDLDLEEIQRDCAENSDESNKAEDNFNNHLTNEGVRYFNLPNLKPKINLYRLKGNKDYLVNNKKNKTVVDTIVIKNSYNNFIKMITELVFDDKHILDSQKEDSADVSSTNNKKMIVISIKENSREIIEKKNYLEELNQSQESINSNNDKNGILNTNRKSINNNNR